MFIPLGIVTLKERIVHSAGTVGYGKKMKHQLLVLVAKERFILRNRCNPEDN